MDSVGFPAHQLDLGGQVTLSSWGYSALCRGLEMDRQQEQFVLNDPQQQDLVPKAHYMQSDREESKQLQEVIRLIYKTLHYETLHENYL